MKQQVRILLLMLALLSGFAPAQAKGGEFGDVVKLVEKHYGVKHKSVPFIARVGIKTGSFVARRLTRYSEYGSVKFAYFENQDFSAPKGKGEFCLLVRDALRADWQMLLEARLERDAVQTYVYTRQEEKFFKVLVVNIGRRDATVVQAQVSPRKLAELLREPASIGDTLSGEAAEDTEEN
jgi:hypothetical protein